MDPSPVYARSVWAVVFDDPLGSYRDAANQLMCFYARSIWAVLFDRRATRPPSRSPTNFYARSVGLWSSTRRRPGWLHPHPLVFLCPLGWAVVFDDEVRRLAEVQRLVLLCPLGWAVVFDQPSAITNGSLALLGALVSMPARLGCGLRRAGSTARSPCGSKFLCPLGWAVVFDDRTRRVRANALDTWTIHCFYARSVGLWSSTGTRPRRAGGDRIVSMPARLGCGLRLLLDFACLELPE